MIKRFVILSGLFFSFQYAINAQTPVLADVQTKKSIMNDFMDLRLGMFIHWGPVAIRGTEIGWSRTSEVPVSVYDNLYKKFNPVFFDAAAWVKIAREAGMKYLTITAKHHDGFCLWPSAYTDYDIMSTPFKKDIVGALAKACEKEEIKFCIYYSVLDWYHPDYPFHSPQNSEWDPRANMGKYIIYMKNQLKELITRYHPYMLWFDGNWEKCWTQKDAEGMYKYIKSLDKNVIINNRLGKGINANLTDESVGDYATPEQKIGAINMDHPWESCYPLGTQWSWKPNDKIKSLKQCIDILAATAGGNGNLLLNISPTSNGKIETLTVERLREIGRWIDKYGDAIFGTRGGPYKPDSTFTSTREGNKIYILLLQHQKGNFTLPAIEDYKLLNARFKGGDKISFMQDAKGIHLMLPENLPDSICSVIVLELNKNADMIPLIDQLAL